MSSHRPIRLGARTRVQLPPARTALYSAIEQQLHEPVVCSAGARGLRHAALGAALSLAALAPLQALHAATLEVDVATDTVAADGGCALREAVDNANANSAVHADCVAGDGLDTIVFDSVEVGATVTLSAELTVTDPLALNGPGRDALTIDQVGTGRHISATVPLSVSGLTFSGGYANVGGAILADSDLTVTSSRFKYNRANQGGALAHSGTAAGVWDIQDTEFENNSAQQQPYGSPGIGGAVFFAQSYDDGSSISIDASTFTGNDAGSAGGALAVLAQVQGSATITDTTFAYNSADFAGGALLSTTTVTVSGTSFNRNQALYSAGGAVIATGKYGGGATADAAKGLGGMVAISDTRFYGNGAGEAGGAQIAGGTVEASGLTVTGNVTTSSYIPVAKGIAVCSRYGRSTGGISFQAAQSLVLTGSTFSGNCAGGNGGGANILLRGTAAGEVADDNTFDSNVAYSSHGGLGVYLAQESSITISGSFSGNRAYAFGGGLGVDIEGAATAVLDGVQSTGNSAYDSGGGISIEADAVNGQLSGASITVVNSTLAGNSARDGGGLRFNGDGRYNSYYSGETIARPSLTIATSTISANTARTDGAGVQVNGHYLGTVALDSATIEGNTISGYGSGGGLAVTLYAGGADAITVNASTISGNSASIGGGLYLHAYNATVEVLNSTVHGNEAVAPVPFAKGFVASESGGGIALRYGALELDLVTLTGNSADDAGGGLALLGSGGTATLRNSIVADNSAVIGGPDISGAVQADFTLVEDATGATITGTNNQTGVDPLLGPLADNGGPTLTRLPLEGSPVINTGDPAFVPPPETDQRGLPRVNGVIDKGAVETPSQVTGITITPASFSEGGTATLTVTLDGAAGSEVLVTVDFSGVALLGTDFTATDADAATAGTQVLIAAGSSSGTSTLAALADGTDEPDEALTATITAASGATYTGTLAASATIVDGDPTPTISIADTSAGEAAGLASFTVTLSNPSSQAITVDFATADGTALAGQDYTATMGTLSFDPGVTSQAIPVALTADAVDEPDETFLVNLANPANATLGDGQAQGTIIDGNATPTVTLSLTQPTMVEESGSTEVVATLSAMSAQDVVVTLDLTGTAAGSDFTIGDDDPLMAGVQIVIPAGQLSGSVTITPIDDAEVEGNETIVVQIAAIANGSGGAVQQVTATIDDSADLAGVGTGEPGGNPAPELIPTLSEWMLMLLGLLLPATVIGRLRRTEAAGRRKL